MSEKIYALPENGKKRKQRSKKGILGVPKKNKILFMINVNINDKINKFNFNLNFKKI